MVQYRQVETLGEIIWSSVIDISQLSNKELKRVYVVVFWKRPFIIVIKVNKQLKDKNTIVLQYLFLNCFQQIVRI